MNRAELLRHLMTVVGRVATIALASHPCPPARGGLAMPNYSRVWASGSHLKYQQCGLFLKATQRFRVGGIYGCGLTTTTPAYRSAVAPLRIQPRLSPPMCLTIKVLHQVAASQEMAGNLRTGQVGAASSDRKPPRGDVRIWLKNKKRSISALLRKKRGDSVF